MSYGGLYFVIERGIWFEREWNLVSGRWNGCFMRCGVFYIGFIEIIIVWCCWGVVRVSGVGGVVCGGVISGMGGGVVVIGGEENWVGVR